MIFGVSSDSAESHAEFAKKHALPFPLIDDSKGRWARAFGVNTVFGMTERVSFLIGPSGNVIKTFPDVDPAVHAKDVLAALDAK